MKKCFQLSILFAFILCFLPDANGFVVDVKSRIEKTNSNDFSKGYNKKTLSKKQVRKLKREERKARRMEKRSAKFQQKWEMRTAKSSLKKDKKRRRFFGGVTDDTRFKIGLILIVASLLVGILVRVPLFGGVLGILAGLAGLVGLILIFLAMLDYYK